VRSHAMGCVAIIVCMYTKPVLTSRVAKVEKPEAKYNVGWSCGKETLADGRYDTLKGSYYANPIHDAALEAKARSLYPKVVEMVTPNVWPSEEVLPGFEAKFEALCQLIVDVAGLVARSCDRYGVAKLAGYKAGTLEEIVRTSVSTKARLLHYFPPPASTSPPAVDVPEKVDDDWCATHTDLGALTGLTSQMFIDEVAHPAKFSGSSPTPLPELEAHPDPKAGLWIRDRAGRTTQVHIPRDSLAFQTGMALQLITRGALQAVPHFVRGGKASGGGENVARNTLAVFTQPNLWVPVDEETGKDFATLAEEVITKGV
jgi:isopenicillin N synthase-like dioxygenase